MDVKAWDIRAACKKLVSPAFHLRWGTTMYRTSLKIWEPLLGPNPNLPPNLLHHLTTSSPPSGKISNKDPGPPQSLQTLLTPQPNQTSNSNCSYSSHPTNPAPDPPSNHQLEITQTASNEMELYDLQFLSVDLKLCQDFQPIQQKLQGFS